MEVRIATQSINNQQKFFPWNTIKISLISFSMKINLPFTWVFEAIFDAFTTEDVQARL